MVLRKPNWRLREARERTPSRRNPGECLSRQDLAQLVAAHVWEHRHRVVHPNDTYIGKLERGAVRRPNRFYREALRAILGAPTDQDLGFRPSGAIPGVSPLDDVERRSLLRGTAALGGLLAVAPGTALSAALAAIDPAPTPSRIGASDIDRIHEASSAFRDLDFSYGGGFALEGALAQVRSATKLLDARCPVRLRGLLYSAVGEMANAAGFMAFDAGRLDAAKRTLQVALACADEADDSTLRVSVLGDLASLARWMGRAQDAAVYLDAAVRNASTPTERALVWSGRARTSAQQGDTQATFAAIGRSDDELSRANLAADAPWVLDWYTRTEHLGQTGRAAYDLVMTTGTTRPSVVDRLATAVKGWSDDFARARAHDQTRLATVVMATGDPDEAAVVGMAALDAIGPIESGRNVEYVRALHEVAGGHAGRPAVAELRARTAGALLARPRSDPQQTPIGGSAVPAPG
jgi:hypothetical protein